MPQQSVMLLLVGLGAGVLSGMFGIGGGIVIGPALILLLSFQIQEAAGTSLAALLLPVSFFAVLAYYRAGKLQIRPAALIALGIVISVFVGAQLAVNLPAETVKRMYGVLLLYVAWRFIEPRKLAAGFLSSAARRRLANEPAEGDPPPAQENAKPVQESPAAKVDAAWYTFLLVGLVAGLLAGLFGIGGGVIIVPIMVTLFHYDLKEANATSLAALLPPVGLPGVLKYYAEGMLDIGVAALIALGLLFGAFVGAKITLGLPSSTVKRLYGVFLLLVGVRFVLGG